MRFKTVRGFSLRAGFVTAVVVAALVGAVIIYGASRLSADSSQANSTGTPAGSGQTLVASSVNTATTSAAEVPDVTDLALSEAQVVLSAAGFSVELSADSDTGFVLSQDPSPGTVAESGSEVLLTLAPRARPKKAANVKAARKAPVLVVCIDPGHQSSADSSPEPIGPGSKTVKPCVTGGTTGVETDLPEYEVVLQISMNLKERLETAGVKVVMTRTTNDVNLSNAQRAEIANRADADLFVRVHADGSPEPEVAGVSTLYPAENRWTKPIVAESRAAAKIVQASTVTMTGAIDRGTVARGDISGFNYAEMPSILIETGFMSNTVEDRLLASPHYQDKLASGMTEGILKYLRQRMSDSAE